MIFRRKLGHRVSYKADRNVTFSVALCDIRSPDADMAVARVVRMTTPNRLAVIHPEEVSWSNAVPLIGGVEDHTARIVYRRYDRMICP
jgi:hypothetical protein